MLYSSLLCESNYLAGCQLNVTTTLEMSFLLYFALLYNLLSCKGLINMNSICDTNLHPGAI